MTYYSKQSLRQNSEIFATSLYTMEAFRCADLWDIIITTGRAGGLHKPP